MWNCDPNREVLATNILCFPHYAKGEHNKRGLIKLNLKSYPWYIKKQKENGRCESSYINNNVKCEWIKHPNQK